ncbi:unnamed protein product, partial [Amoebophrya sp. A25]|eukprot:GSA25T00016466001.1
MGNLVGRSAVQPLDPPQEPAGAPVVAGSGSNAPPKETAVKRQGSQERREPGGATDVAAPESKRAGATEGGGRYGKERDDAWTELVAAHRTLQTEETVYNAEVRFARISGASTAEQRGKLITAWDEWLEAKGKYVGVEMRIFHSEADEAKLREKVGELRLEQDQSENAQAEKQHAELDNEVPAAGKESGTEDREGAAAAEAAAEQERAGPGGSAQVDNRGSSPLQTTESSTVGGSEGKDAKTAGLDGPAGGKREAREGRPRLRQQHIWSATAPEKRHVVGDNAFAALGGKVPAPGETSPASTSSFLQPSTITSSSSSTSTGVHQLSFNDPICGLLLAVCFFFVWKSLRKACRSTSTTSTTFFGTTKEGGATSSTFFDEEENHTSREETVAILFDEAEGDEDCVTASEGSIAIPVDDEDVERNNTTRGKALRT